MHSKQSLKSSAKYLMSAGAIAAMVYTGPASADTGFMRSVGTSDVTPRVSLMGRGIATLDGSVGKTGAGRTQTDSQIDFSDSFLDGQFDSRLYSGVHGGLLLGLRFPDAGSGVGQVFYHQANVFLQSQHWGLRLGRTSLPNYLIAFPTLRDSDLIAYTQIPNALVNNDASEYAQYGNVVRADYYGFHGRLRLSGFAANQFESSPTGQLVDRFTVNSGGAQARYALVPGERYDSWLRQVGGEVYYQDVRDVPGKRREYSYLASAIINLNRDPSNHWELRLQGVFNQGAGVHSVATVLDQARARSQAYVASIRNVHAPYLVPRLQTALTVAYQRFSGVDASRFSVVPSVTYRVGANMSLVAQYAYTHNQGALQVASNGPGAGLKNNNTVTVGLSYSFGATSNNYFGNRNSLLNVEHGYLP